MRKFKDLEFIDKLNFYHWIVKVPSVTILFFLAFYSINYSVICYLFVLTIVSDLIFFGIMDNKKNYTYSNLAIDTLCLFFAAFLSNFFVTPFTIVLLDKFELLFTESFWVNYFSLLISIISLFLFWYVIILIQKLIYPNMGNWKWKNTGLFNSTAKQRLKMYQS